MELPHTALPERKTVVLLTTHKAGSTIADRIIATLHAEIGVPHVNLANMAWKRGVQPQPFIEENVGLLDRSGYYFGPLRSPLIDNLGDFKKQRVIMHVRDPRDCIVSFYFSMAASHVEPPPGATLEGFQEVRQRVGGKTIDRYALARTEAFRTIMDQLDRIAADHPDYLISKYERMVTKTDAWLRQLCRFLDIPLTAPLKKKLAPLLDFSVSGEHQDRHKRQVLPGDHRRKLLPATVKKMTSRLNQQLTAFDYLPKAEAEPAAAAAI